MGGPSFNLSVTSSEAELCQDLQDTEPMQEPPGWCSASVWVSMGLPTHEGRIRLHTGVLYQAVLLRLGLGLQIQVLQTFPSP